MTCATGILVNDVSDFIQAISFSRREISVSRNIIYLLSAVFPRFLCFGSLDLARIIVLLYDFLNSWESFVKV